ncbi:MAG: hypothetical protein IJ727_02280 [Treponema sp.]|nr:hypothetical protein [Treponema sp.]
MKQNQKKIHFLTAFLLLLCCLSVFFVHADFDHDCEGEDCPVCAVIQMARTNFQNLNFDSDNSLQVQFISFVALSLFAVSAILVSKTPITEKTKLNN